MDSLDCNTGLLLGLGFSHGRQHDSDLRSTDPENETKKKLVLKFDDIIPSLTLGLSGQVFHSSVSEIIVGESAGADDLLRQGSSASAVSSFSNSSTLKRERDIWVGGEEKEAEVEAEIETETDVFLERVCLKVGEEEEDGSPRKKLRLTKEQSAILEDSFKEHASLSPKQKQELARQLNLRPRQVEVWFQNRRARTKLKQTEMDCELLKKCCEKLKEENSRLQKELQELKSLKLMAPPFCMQLQAAATLTVCPSCERSICIGADESPSSTAFSIGPKPHFLKYPFSHPSAAC